MAQASPTSSARRHIVRRRHATTVPATNGSVIHGSTTTVQSRLSRASEKGSSTRVPQPVHKSGSRCAKSTDVRLERNTGSGRVPWRNTAQAMSVAVRATTGAKTSEWDRPRCACSATVTASPRARRVSRSGSSAASTLASNTARSVEEARSGEPGRTSGRRSAPTASPKSPCVRLSMARCGSSAFFARGPAAGRKTTPCAPSPVSRLLQPVGPRLPAERAVDERRDDAHARVLGVVAVGRLVDAHALVVAHEAREERVHAHELAAALPRLPRRLDVLVPLLLLHLLAGVRADEGDDGAAVAGVDGALVRDEVAVVVVLAQLRHHRGLVRLPVRVHGLLVVRRVEALIGEARVVVVPRVARVRELIIRELHGHHAVDGAEVALVERRGQQAEHGV